MFESDLSLFVTKFLPVFLYPVGAAAGLTLVAGALTLLGYRRSGAAAAISAGALLWA